ncbi:membrane protein insertase YidC [Thermomonas sp. S9]|uniref:membrane protein insertase YidC n=1 Tax=Thermomonas sp. S9 TaxID=2885203 RepID=UPI00216AFFA6|nr:membrane protein insertase YidC [Thermomonas sp. S9]MCR6495074.1 membrane protein insertase YidC [Thermomonas sp. S9]
MNQTRTFLLAAWLMVAFLLWREWGTPPQETAAAAVPAATATGALAAVPAIPAATPAASAPAAAASVAVPAPVSVQLRNDVLALVLDGRAVTHAELLKYPQSRAPGSPPVVLFDADPTRFFAAEALWRDAQGRELAWQPQGAARAFTLAAGQPRVQAVFEATAASGLRVQRTFTLARGSYALQVRDEVVNAGSSPWSGDIDRRLERVPPVVKSGFTNPESFSLNGAAWYSPQDKYKKRKYPDFTKDGPLNLQVTGGWVALSQHYFLAAWVPQPDQPALYTLGEKGALYSISARGPAITLAPGQRFESDATLWVGPKLADKLDATAPGLGLAMDYGIFTVLSKPIHWLLTQLHKLTHNWGWAIVLLVVLIKLVLYPLSAAQYRSMAKMRKFQPRIEQLKERYGDDKQKFQMAMLDLYKKEKINPAGGCLPVLIQMPVFLALYYVLLEAVELRQAPWIVGWVNDLTARDPYFILPLLNAAIMFLTQRMTPMVGMDPMQKKMMQLMPLVMAVMFAFFPAGLVLYWVTNGALGMLQQWWNTKRFAEAPAKAA